jgi:hypothetical protein
VWRLQSWAGRVNTAILSSGPMAHFQKTEKTLDLFTHNPVLLIKNFPVFTDSLLSYGCHGDFLSPLCFVSMVTRATWGADSEKSHEILVLMNNVNWSELFLVQWFKA